ncbi:TMEM175 family protein [Methanosphaera sp. ISO3-F5]|uniref:TMEM175 family protein n=1 Tax=Methanosphaera sp. ISO3-F5 TaxID=1452353 RepID=UPI002B25F6DD|nr:TMEM175 family protein [Methanosphaera sp. ISO3-F5]WQH63911.1 TMEM175 family protein [Methanosphaera sp. ISO3-F5]
MQTERFEALIDAILAIIITIIVMEIPLPATPTWTSLLELNPEFIAYTTSFLICFNLWNYHHTLFNVVNKLDSTITWASAISMMIIGLLPHATTMLSTNMNSFTAQAMFGLIFFLTNINFYIVDQLLIRKDPANIALRLKLKNTKQNMIFTTILYTIGYIIAYTYYPPAIMITCLLSIILSFLPQKTKNKIKLPL